MVFSKRILVSLFAFTNILFIVLFQLYVFRILGASSETDAYVASIAIPQYLGMVFGVAILHILIPRFQRSHYKNRVIDLWRVFFTISAILILMILFFNKASNGIISNLLPGLPDEQVTRVSEAFFYTNISIYFMLTTSIWTAFRFSEGKYLFCEIASLVSNVIPFILIINFQNILTAELLAKFFLLRNVTNSLLISPITSINFNFFNPITFLSSFKDSYNLLGVSAISKADQLADKYILSAALPGQMSLYTLALQLNVLSSSIISKGFVNDSLSALSIHDVDHLTHIKNKQIILCFFYIIFVLSVYMIGTPILNIILVGNSFSLENVEQLISITLLISGVFIGGLIGQLANYQLISIDKRHILFRYTLITVPIYIIIRYFTFSIYGIYIMCLFIGLIYIIDSIILNVIYRKYMRN